MSNDLVAAVEVACAVGRKACQSRPGKAASNVLRASLPAVSGSSRTYNFSNVAKPDLTAAMVPSDALPVVVVLLPRTNTCKTKA